MPITVNEGGVLHELEKITVNEGGVLHELGTVHANEGGVLYEIYGALPKSLVWNAEKQYASAYPQARINSTSQNGLTVNVTVLKGGFNIANQSGVYSDAVKIKAGTKIHIDVSGLSGNGAHTRQITIGICASGSSLAESKEISGDYTVMADGEYQFFIIGMSSTYSGSASGMTTTNYAVTGTISFSFSH